MSMGRTYGVVLVGMDGHLIEVEADIGQSVPAFVLLGLPDASLRESQDRIRSAAKNTGLDLPARKLTVNLLPASLPKSGSGLDLAILMSAWQSDGKVEIAPNVVFLAELGLDGRLRPVQGVLPAVAAAAKAGMETVVVAAANAPEAALVPHVTVLAGDYAGQVAAHFAIRKTLQQFPEDVGLAQYCAPDSTGDHLTTAKPGERGPGQVDPEGRSASACGSPEMDLHDVHGQPQARFALELAAAGAHHVMLMGSPGAGKTMLASRLPSILPPLDDDAAMEATAIGSITRHVTAPVTQLRRRPPFEAPHHSASAASIVGGGGRLARPGAITRAHRGVLFLDEAPEFNRHVLDALRQPLETGYISLHRSAGHVTYPAQFQLVLAANPCPCGMNIGTGSKCTCSVQLRRNYRSRLSGPLLDRIDVQVHVDRPKSAAMEMKTPAESSAVVLKRVTAARQAQRERLARWGLSTNAEVPLQLLSSNLRLPPGVTRLLDSALDRAALSLRGYVRVLRLAWTLADLSQRSTPDESMIDIAMHMRLTTTPH